ncbi:MAG TPA: SRPBCC family protein [Noviherbaspirillum sp.]|uniref:SRPBCC family protein n=1 Tax=Noviherbaspirillum sp. TaxID=1926288 RepID=UPI002B464DE2|nr:SRPBCC family protein [Noviherbaspirillum sp.]HJV86393.1 SRPBCC family protein [Noviherbaspirillum sp.]
MATVQQSIDIQRPLHAVYDLLTHFEDYPEFMEEVENVQRLDDSHLHWTTRMANRSVDWDAEITAQEPDRCIAWRNTSGPTSSGRVELQEAGSQASHVTITLESEPQQVPGSMAGENESEMARRLKMDLARMKDFIEARGSESEAWRSEEYGAPITTSPAEGERGAPRNAPIPTSSYAAGSEGWIGEEDSSAPVRTAPAAAQRNATEQRNDSAGSPASDMTGKTRDPGSTAALQAQPERDTQPGASGNAAVGGTAAAVGAAGGTEASAGAAMAGGPQLGGVQAGSGAVTGQGNSGPVTGAATAGGTGLGSAEQDAGAEDTRTVPRADAAKADRGAPGIRKTGDKTGNSGSMDKR